MGHNYRVNLFQKIIKLFCQGSDKKHLKEFQPCVLISVSTNNAWIWLDSLSILIDQFLYLINWEIRLRVWYFHSITNAHRRIKLMQMGTFASKLNLLSLIKAIYQFYESLTCDDPMKSCAEGNFNETSNCCVRILLRVIYFAEKKQLKYCIYGIENCNEARKVFEWKLRLHSNSKN